MFYFYSPVYDACHYRSLFGFIETTKNSYAIGGNQKYACDERHYEIHLKPPPHEKNT